MKPSESGLFHDALALPEGERLRLVDTLLESLHPDADPQVDAAWRDEAERRLARLDAGECTLVDGEAAFRRLRAKYHG
ncbi:addiction module protein [Thiohalocapsa sp. ML1]|jgi:putative addiction module component (TIGR02574 family)|uniref:addiction module protein n=1 Tax=Thiohalocapsa sp. ML1 TaxID=1431688 RepID=UPI0007322D86|nr:addiction module protein [Thiohalocapsa sp. ML1]